MRRSDGIPTLAILSLFLVLGDSYRILLGDGSAEPTDCTLADRSSPRRLDPRSRKVGGVTRRACRFVSRCGWSSRSGRPRVVKPQALAEKEFGLLFERVRDRSRAFIGPRQNHLRTLDA